MYLPDIQKTEDTRGVRIDRVGVTSIRMPVQVLRKGTLQVVETVGSFELDVDLPDYVKGTHMSRFSAILNEHVSGGGVFSATDIQQLAEQVLVQLQGSTQARVRMECDYFIRQAAPSTGLLGIAPLKAVLAVHTSKEVTWHTTGIEIEGKTCCPCSREISGYDPVTGMGRGAHSQRGKATIEVKHGPAQLIWFEDLIEICFKAFSSPVYPVLKRPDEKAVTEAAYDNPKFVEDVVRDIAVGLQRDILTYQDTTAYVRVENAESIHYHNAFAEVFLGGR